jgi:hypothetical protein
MLMILIPSLGWSFFPDTFQNDPKGNQIFIKFKDYKGMRDWVFVDGLGREVSFRGINMSNKSKGRVDNFLPFKNVDEARFEIGRFKAHMGGNLIRWLFTWGAIVPEPGKINQEYLDNQIAYIKIAAQMGIHVLIDIHQDLFGIGNHGEYAGENGPPAWIYDGLKLPEGKCGKICITWSQNYVTNKRVRAAFNRFWTNACFDTPKGKKCFQDEYFFMMENTLKYMREKLSPMEWSFIVGIDPLNEPIPGDYEKGENYPDWTNNKLFPFYQKVRSSLNSLNMEEKLVFSEPSTFWNVRIPLAFFLIRPSGPLSLTRPVGPGFVFNSHHYDEVRESYGILRAENGTYLKELDLVRMEARKMAAPPILTEYGAWKNEKRARVQDPARLYKADYQAMEMTNPRGRFANFYSPLISGTQWEWGIVGYNPEYFGHGLSKDKAQYEGFGHRIVERGYPRRVQGDLMHFYYNDGGKDLFKFEDMNWVGIKTNELRGKKAQNPLFSQNKFAFIVTRGKFSPAPTEIFIPRNFDIFKTIILTDEGVLENPKVVLDSELGGKRLFISSETNSLYHFALILERGPMDNLSPKQWEELRLGIAARVNQEKSPLYLTGKIRKDFRSYRP